MKESSIPVEASTIKKRLLRTSTLRTRKVNWWGSNQWSARCLNWMCFKFKQEQSFSTQEEPSALVELHQTPNLFYIKASRRDLNRVGTTRSLDEEWMVTGSHSFSGEYLGLWRILWECDVQVQRRRRLSGRFVSYSPYPWRYVLISLRSEKGVILFLWRWRLGKFQI